MRLPLILAVTLISHYSIAQDTSHLIAPEQAGHVRIGDDAQSVYESFPQNQRRLVDLALEGNLTPALAITLLGSEIERGIVAELGPRENRLVVTRIKISDPALKTAEGIGVGSSMADLRSTYEIAHIGYGEGSSFAIVESLAASFELDQSRIELSQVTDPNEVPDNVRIVRILLWLR